MDKGFIQAICDVAGIKADKKTVKKLGLVFDCFNAHVGGNKTSCTKFHEFMKPTDDMVYLGGVLKSISSGICKNCNDVG